jgi:two-component system, cell cycle sensor histidine kinase and response regulator CckA
MVALMSRTEAESDRRCEAVGAGVVILNAGACITYANHPARVMLSLSGDAWRGRQFPGAGLAAIREDGSEFPVTEYPPLVALATGKPAGGIVVGISPSETGTTRWILMNAEPVLDSDTGVLEEVLTTMVDVTDLKCAQRSLEQSAQRFRSLVETTSDWVWETDENLVYTYSNPRVRDILGYEPEEILGRTPWDLMPPDEVKRVSAITAEVVSARRPLVALENTNVHKSGRLVVLETSGIPFFDAAGEFRGFRGIDRDITGRKRTEETLRKSEAFLRSTTDLLPARIAYVDAEQRYRFVNDRYEKWFGKTRDELIGQHARDLLGGPLYERVRPYIDAALSGEQVAYDMDVEVKGGEQRNLSIVYVPHFGENGRVLGFFASIEDITERKRLEEQLLHSQKMEAVGVLAGGIAHDFNNLLTVIGGYSRFVLDQLRPGDPMADQLEEIEKAANRAAMLTRQLLAFSSRQMLQPKVLDLNAVVADIETMIRRLISESIEFRTELEPGLGRVRADPSQIDQVIMNLVVNARDAMPDGGRLTIATRDLELDAPAASRRPMIEAGRYALLTVSDTGHGMDAETRKHLFEPFFTTKGLGRGTGLGLATTYGIVRQSGGHITVDSELGRGATFNIYLPVVDETHEPAQPAPALEAASAGKGTILLVEDEPALLAMARQALAGQGYTVLTAADGEHALEVAGGQRGAIDLLLTDVVMPRLGGRELARRLETLRPGMRVLYMSGYADGQLAHEGVLEAGLEVLQKPFTPRALLRSVRDSLRRK